MAAKSVLSFWGLTFIPLRMIHPGGFPFPPKAGVAVIVEASFPLPFFFRLLPGLFSAAHDMRFPRS
jgi:hypothetical protein